MIMKIVRFEYLSIEPVNVMQNFHCFVHLFFYEVAVIFCLLYWYLHSIYISIGHEFFSLVFSVKRTISAEATDIYCFDNVCHNFFTLAHAFVLVVT